MDGGKLIIESPSEDDSNLRSLAERHVDGGSRHLKYLITFPCETARKKFSHFLFNISQEKMAINNAREFRVETEDDFDRTVDFGLSET